MCINILQTTKFQENSNLSFWRVLTIKQGQGSPCYRNSQKSTSKTNPCPQEPAFLQIERFPQIWNTMTLIMSFRTK